MTTETRLAWDVVRQLKNAEYDLYTAKHHELVAIRESLGYLIERLGTWADGAELAEAVGDDDPACTCRELGPDSCGKHGGA